MPPKTINGVPLEAILEPFEDKPELAERIAHRKVKGPAIAIVEPDAQWPEHFQTFRSRILAAFDPQTNNGHESESVTVLSIDHVGSTSIPTLPAKPVIDIALVLSSVAQEDEAYYVPRLESCGFQFLIREPAWHGHRFFAAWRPMSCNLHVFGPACAEVERHRIFKEWLLAHAEDRQVYARVKRESAEVSRAKGETDVMAYNSRKEGVIKEILEKAFAELGGLDE